jgi:hypothetical protein
LLVKLVDEAGKTLAQDAKSFLAVKELDTVVVQGRIHREGDSLSVLASGVFVKKK